MYFISWLSFLKFARFSSGVKKQHNESKVVTQECKHIQPQKRYFDGTNCSLSVRVMTKGSRYAQQIIITQAGTMKFGLS